MSTTDRNLLNMTTHRTLLTMADLIGPTYNRLSAFPDTQVLVTGNDTSTGPRVGDVVTGHPVTSSDGRLCWHKTVAEQKDTPLFTSGYDVFHGISTNTDGVTHQLVVAPYGESLHDWVIARTTYMSTKAVVVYDNRILGADQSSPIGERVDLPTQFALPQGGALSRAFPGSTEIPVHMVQKFADVVRALHTVDGLIYKALGHGLDAVVTDEFTEFLSDRGVTLVTPARAVAGEGFAFVSAGVSPGEMDEENRRRVAAQLDVDVDTVGTDRHELVQVPYQTTFQTIGRNGVATEQAQQSALSQLRAKFRGPVAFRASNFHVVYQGSYLVLSAAADLEEFSARDLLEEVEEFANKIAGEQGWCDEFESAMEEVGLESTRTREWDALLSVNVTIHYSDVSSRTDDCVMSDVGDQDVAELSLGSITAEGTATVTVTVTADDETDVPNQITGYEIDLSPEYTINGWEIIDINPA